jgi:hypothetical protein
MSQTARSNWDHRSQRSSLDTESPVAVRITYRLTTPWARLREVYYGNSREDALRAGFNDDDLHRELALPAALRRIPMVSLMREEAYHAFQEWQWSPQKVEY